MDYIWVPEIIIDGWVHKGYTYLNRVFGKLNKSLSSTQPNLNLWNWQHPQISFYAVYWHKSSGQSACIARTGWNWFSSLSQCTRLPLEQQGATQRNLVIFFSSTRTIPWWNHLNKENLKKKNQMAYLNFPSKNNLIFPFKVPYWQNKTWSLLQ